MDADKRASHRTNVLSANLPKKNKIEIMPQKTTACLVCYLTLECMVLTLVVRSSTSGGRYHRVMTVGV